MSEAALASVGAAVSADETGPTAAATTPSLKQSPMRRRLKSEDPHLSSAATPAAEGGGGNRRRLGSSHSAASESPARAVARLLGSSSKPAGDAAAVVVGRGRIHSASSSTATGAGSGGGGGYKDRNEPIDHAIRGRLDGLDALSLGPARGVSVAPNPSPPSPSSPGGGPERRERADGGPTYPASRMVEDMILTSSGSDVPEMVLEGFRANGEDRWTLRIDVWGAARRRREDGEPKSAMAAAEEGGLLPATASTAPVGPPGRGGGGGFLEQASPPQLQPVDTDTDTDTTHSASTPGGSSALCCPSPSQVPTQLLMEQMWGKDNVPPPNFGTAKGNRQRARSSGDAMAGTPSPKSKSDEADNSDDDNDDNDVLALAAACSVPIDVDEDMFLIEDAAHLQAVHDIASVPLQQAKYDDALDIFDRILRSLNTRYKNEPYYLVGSVLHNIGIIKMWAGRYDEALATLHAAVRIRVDSLPLDHPDVAVSLAKAGTALFALDRFSDALSSFERALQLLEVDNTSRAKILNNIGVARYQMGDNVEALRAFTAALEIQRSWLEGPIRRETTVYDASVTLGNMGKVYLERDDYEMSFYVYEESLLLQTTSFRKNHEIVLTTLGNLAFAKARKGEKVKALQIYNGIVRSQIAKYGPDSRETVETTGLMSVLHIQLCNYEEALKCLTDVLRWQRKNLEASHPAIRNTKSTIKKIEQALNGEVSVWI